MSPGSILPSAATAPLLNNANVYELTDNLYVFNNFEEKITGKFTWTGLIGKIASH